MSLWLYRMNSDLLPGNHLLGRLVTLVPQVRFLACTFKVASLAQRYMSQSILFYNRE